MHQSTLAVISFFSWLNLLIKVQGYEKIDLSTNEWLLENNRLNISLPTEIPGGNKKGLSVHTTLMINGIIDNIIDGFNDVKFAWIADESWTFKTSFNCKCT
uniref:Beta-mannosidase-like galactose-binding domain-containing protein n=1 Tax=Clytia hemisphaerica TaxID=252671 RepID=A0A7M5XN33_9CNID